MTTQQITNEFTHNAGYLMKVIGDTEYLTEAIIERLKGLGEPIYFNDLDSKYWLFDFKIGDLWFEVVPFTESENIRIFEHHETPFVLNCFNPLKKG